MPSHSKDGFVPQAPAVSPAPVAHEGAARAFWRVLTRFDSSKLTPYHGLRNSIGVLLPVAAGFALNMPRGGVAAASGALWVAFSDGGDPYAQRARRMLSSSVLCALAVLLGTLSGNHNAAAVIIATLWAFAAGMFVAPATPPPEPGVASLVPILIFTPQPLPPNQPLSPPGPPLAADL